MIVISGVPRSGTSVCMDIVKSMLGEGRLFGSQFMDKDLKQVKPEMTPIATYNAKKFNQDNKEFHDMNPKGFYECQFTVQGIKWNFRNSDILHEDILSQGTASEKFCKVVSNGLFNSQPRYINKIIYMLRDPREVAKSQERLSREIEIPEGEKIHDPKFFITATLQAAMWQQKFKKDMLLVNHKNLMTTPEIECNRIAKFLGVGSGKAHKIVDTALYRSNPEDIDMPTWEDADKIYDLFGKGEYQAIIDYMKNEKTAINKESRRWICHRNSAQVSEAQCKLCISNPVVMENFKKYAEKRRVDWKKEPCAYECGMNLDKPPISIDQSIKNNSWQS